MDRWLDDRVLGFSASGDQTLKKQLKTVKKERKPAPGIDDDEKETGIPHFLSSVQLLSRV